MKEKVDLFTGKSDVLDSVIVLVQALAEAFALGRLAGSIETFDDNQGTSSA